MKTIIFFDLDGTIHNKTKKEISKNTIKLLNKLYNDPNVELGFATGRSPKNINVLDDLIHLFKYKVYINGALAYRDNELIYQNNINQENILTIYNKVINNNIMTGFILEDNEFVLNLKKDIEGINYKNISEVTSLTNDELLKNRVYQIWMFDIKEEVISVLKDTKLNKYSWHRNGYDIVDRNTNKSNAIKALLKNKKYKLVTVGDGQNDIDMIKLADIGIAMDNSGFPELKKEATYVAPHINKDKLYDFFKEIKLIS